jgi:NadR type nicotinamide-nucleotide adenylyltransferase
MIKKIVAIGPESTGKTAQCELLAKHFNTNWCPEYAREYLSKNGKNYSFENLETIAKGQIALENSYTEKTQKSGNKLLFIDTDMYVMKVWCEYVFGKCHQFILNEIVSRKYDLYLLCNVDLPWEADELREYPDEKTRLELYNIYKDILLNQHTPYVVIGGNYKERLQKAAEAVENLLK